MASAQGKQSAPAPTEPKEPTVPFSEENVSNSDTVLLIHGAFVSRQDWDLVTPQLSSYHLLLPDLPSHGEALALRPFSKRSASRLLAQLIRNHAHGGKAHVVGHSLGAVVAVEMMSTYPELVDQVFVSGFPLLHSTASYMGPWGFWMESQIQTLVPKSLVRWLMDGTEMGQATQPSVRFCREVVQSLVIEKDEWKGRKWPERVCIFVAEKGGIVPSADSLEAAQTLAEAIRSDSSRNRPAIWTHAAMRHPWNRQAPELFAEAVSVWFEGHDLPEKKGFKRKSSFKGKSHDCKGNIQ